ncbi:MAG: acyltransferase [Bacteroidales bacterium]|nr:acyltransferase [Bacteroidales bacterium]
MHTSNRSLNLDILRIFSICAIISLHVANGYLSFLVLPKDFNWWFTALTYDAIFKWGTIVFIMLSGTLLLGENKNKSVSIFLWNRFKRIFIPFLIWYLIYKFTSDDYFHDFSLKSIFLLFTDFIKGNVHYHLWFVYLIFGLYLLTPILSVFINKASNQIIHYYFLYWAIFTIIPPFLEKYYNISFALMPYIELQNYVGFYLIGYYLHNTNFKIKNTYFLLLPISIIANLILSTFHSMEIQKTDYFFLNRFSIFNTINAILIFLLFLRINFNSILIFKKNKEKIAKISNLCFGVFLCHVFIIWILDSGTLGIKLIAYSLNEIYVHIAIGFPVIITTTIILSFAFCYFISNIPFVKRLMI